MAIFAWWEICFNFLFPVHRYSEGMVQAVKQMEEKGLLVEDKGALICDLKVALLLVLHLC